MCALQPEPTPPPRQPGCLPGLRSVRCSDLGTGALFLGLLFLLSKWFVRQGKLRGGAEGLYQDSSGAGAMEALLGDSQDGLYPEEGVQYPAVEAWLRAHFKRQVPAVASAGFRV